MYIKNQSLTFPLLFSSLALLTFAVWSAAIVIGFQYYHLKFLTIPFLPISLIGTALSFYLGFKTNASYDRIWEARKIWGGIVNDSRAWVTLLNAYFTNHNNKLNEDEIKAIKLDLTNRHIAWLYAHKYYLRHKHQPWEHRGKINNKYRALFQKDFSISTKLDTNLQDYLTEKEVAEIIDTENPAAQILNNQAKKLNQLHNENAIELFRLIELQSHITKLLEHQGMNERIKNFPYPRQYSMMVRVFVRIFTFLLPFGLLAEMSKQGDLFIWLTIPFSTLVSWVFYYMDVTSEISENPFEGLVYDVPITSMTRNIEIDMLQMIGVVDIPKPIMAKNGVLM
jgi:ion channel-forming bestrophin family protein